jgi:flavin-binding protein dodecin
MRWLHRAFLIQRTDRTTTEERAMAKKGDSGVYRITEVIGTSTNSWEEAAKNAVATAAGTIRDLRVAELTKLDMRLDEAGKVVQFRARVSLSFKYEA